MTDEPDNYGLKLSKPKAIVTWGWLVLNVTVALAFLVLPVIAGIASLWDALMVLVLLIVIQELSTGALKRWIYGRQQGEE